jgi:hypothetical protein
MPTSTRHVTVRLMLAMVLVALAAPGAARAADPAQSTISACNPDNLTVVGKIKLTGKDARKARGAVLQIRFQALGLFGFPRSGEWRTVGKKTKASGQEVIGGLAADNWIGVLSWRFKRGSKTVLSGDARSQPLKIGSSKGRANCIVAEGTKRVDSTPPQIFVLPVDEVWHKAPGQLQVAAQDDFSGVQSIRYSVDGGPATPIGNGGVVSIANEGAHTIDVAATDVAGNTATRSATLKVDAAPPTAPALSKPSSITASKTPTFQWSASTDSGSGLRGYGLVILREDGSVAGFQVFDANTTSAPSPVALEDGKTYTAFVRAFDDTSPDPQTTDSARLTFKIDTAPEMAVTPAGGTVLSGGARSTNFTITPDRPVDPSSISVVLHNVDTNADVQTTAGCSGTPCTSIVVDPQPDPLPEGRYTLTVNGLKSDEGTAFPTFVAKYSVTFMEGGTLTAQSTGVVCAQGMNQLAGPNFTSSANGETATLDFDWTANNSGAWTLQARINNAAAGGNDTASGNAAGSGHVHMGPFNIAQGQLTFVLTVACPTTKVDLTNMLGARVP